MSLHSASNCLRPAVRQLSSASRSFSTTPAILSNAVPPQSPSYIRLPSPPQSQTDEAKPPRVRGSLPVPRQVFPRSEGDRKIQPEYIQKTAPRSASEREPSNESQRWKREMAETRRTNLEQGLKALYTRREKSDAARNARVSRKFKEHNEAAAAPEREDDRLTRSTVLDAILDTQVYPDPERFARAQRSKFKVQAKEKAKYEARRDALMELYINASNFIVQESELKAEIDEIFSEDYFRKQSQFFQRYGTTENSWGIYGKPPSIANMLETTTGKSTKLMDYYESEYDRSVKRQKRIAEEFTGGKME
ncbi:uncharacterized protein Triagg1_9229 [Trichoderma aggressivum f. europaeum]|uniref:Uncharacterized protein n=1 Tax=Trichoderma aggressivum f. europaeum TaxID=173218 RepID=A0AAE1I7B3_9HYPO|nr:hypothetical protein Triagg1_9229 [Trichoderma aggressivum f. europaeum]